VLLDAEPASSNGAGPRVAEDEVAERLIDELRRLPERRFDPHRQHDPPYGPERAQVPPLAR